MNRSSLSLQRKHIHFAVNFGCSWTIQIRPLRILKQPGRFDDQVAQAYDKRAEKRRSAGETTEADADTAKARELRDAMATKPSAEKAPTSSAEGFDPGTSIQ